MQGRTYMKQNNTGPNVNLKNLTSRKLKKGMCICTYIHTYIHSYTCTHTYAHRKRRFSQEYVVPRER